MSFHFEAEESEFLQLIKKELSYKTSEEVVPRIAAVLQAYRQTLTTDQANLIVNELPEYFKLSFIVNWHYSDEPVSISYLDEFVELLLKRDQEKSLFKSEVEALSVSILVFKKIIELVECKEMILFKPSLLQEINSIPAEAAAA